MNDIYEMTVSSRLKQLREEKGVKQVDIADIIGVAVNTYCQYETGKRIISIKHLCKIADEYTLTLDWFVGRDVETLKKIKYS